MNRFFYSVHKWVSAAAFVQLALWTVSGFLFAWIPQEKLKSTPVEGAHRGVVVDAPAVTIARVIEVASAEAGAIESIELRGTPTGPSYVVRGDKAIVRIDARSGELHPVGKDEAEAVARRDQPGAPAVRETTLVKESPAIEYRDCEHGDCTLPAFRVALADAAGTVIYVDAATGDVKARRNDTWRTYDFLWSLHIMDYRGRENFNHLLIRGAAALAVATVLSGIVILAIRASRWLRGRLAGRSGRASRI